MALEHDPTEVLREAARLMRERAAAATPGPWVGEYRAVRSMDARRRRTLEGLAPVVLQGAGTHRHHLVPRDEQNANAAHAASWHPDVALAVADWLDGEADLDDLLKAHGKRGMTDASPSVKVARAYLGES